VNDRDPVGDDPTGLRASRARRQPAGGRGRGGAPDGEGPSFLTMIGLVAVVVAAVILIFFAIGYVMGRVFL
jgi:hypothetical protein